MFRKIAPGLVVGAAIGGTIAFLASNHPTGLRWLAILAAALFAGFSLLYFYWASRPNRKGGYQCSVLERAGILISGFAALGMGAKLAYPSALPGSTLAYFFGALLLAFVVRPILASIGANNDNSEQGGGGQAATRAELK